MSTIEKQELIHISEFRSKSYWFLARCFTQRPEMVFLKEIHTSLSNTTSEIEGKDSSDLLTYINLILSDKDDITEILPLLGKDYTRLFRGIEEGYGPPPPYASIYLEGKFMGDSTIDIIRHYKKAGFEIIDDELSPQDHIGAEFKFMSMLCFQENESWAQGEIKQAKKLLGYQKEFFEQYILSWIPDYCEKLLVETKQDFYLYIIKITQQVLEQDKLLMSELNNELGYDK